MREFLNRLASFIRRDRHNHDLAAEIESHLLFPSTKIYALEWTRRKRAGRPSSGLVDYRQRKTIIAKRVRFHSSNALPTMSAIQSVPCAASPVSRCSPFSSSRWESPPAPLYLAS